MTEPPYLDWTDNAPVGTGYRVSGFAPLKPGATMTVWIDFEVPLNAPDAMPEGMGWQVFAGAHYLEIDGLSVQVDNRGPSLTSSAAVSTDRPVLSGTAEPDAVVTVSRTGGATVCAGTADASGTWSCTPSVSLPAGPSR